MELQQAIRERRSVRVFSDAPVARDIVEGLVEAASYSPSWKNAQTVRYTAIYRRELIDEIASKASLDFAWNKRILENAPLLVVLTTLHGRSGYERDGAASTSKGSHWESFDAGIAAQTFCLAAHERGLGTVVLGVFDEPKVQALLGLPENEWVSALIPVGYPAETPAAPPRKAVETLLRVVE